MFGLVRETPQSETTPFYPRSPYGAAKVYGYWVTVNYREAYGFHASNGILFNHESPLRGETFVTRKITRAVARIALGIHDGLYLGNLDSLRDWGHARDYVRAMWLMLQQDDPDDYVIASGEQHSVRELVQRAFAEVGLHVRFEGTGVDEVGVLDAVDERLLEKARNGYGLPEDQCDRCEPLVPGRVVVRVDPRYFRPTEVATLLGDPTKARERLGWEVTIDFGRLVHEMVWQDVEDAQRTGLLAAEGFAVSEPQE